jgi:hypothetical protein
MKKIILYSVLISLLTSSAIAFSGNGSGTEADPYQITNVQQLQEMNDDLSAHYILMNDIDASETREWKEESEWNEGEGFVPIGIFEWGEPSLAFTGTLDGQGYKISDLYINRPDEEYVAIFRCVADNGVIKNVIIDNANIIGSENAGILVGITHAFTEGTEARIQDCSIININFKKTKEEEQYYSALNWNLLGVSPLIGPSFEFYILQHIQIGGGLGIFSIGGHIDYFLGNISTTSPNYSLGFTMSEFGFSSSSASIYSILFGFHLSNDNFKFSAYAGPARFAEYSDTRYTIYGGLTIGIRF